MRAAAASPFTRGAELAEERGGTLRKLDKESVIRFSHENPSVVKCYENYLQKPCLIARTNCCIPTTRHG